MPAVCRAGVDIHGCGTLDTVGSPDTFVNGSPVHRFGDDHDHLSTQVGCSPDVFVNGLGVARVGDDHSGCVVPSHPPSPQVTGSPDTFAN